jgi:aspartate beta-hydroxylase
MVTQVVTLLEDSYAAIKKEYLEVAHNVFSDYQSDTEHHTLHQGRWDWHSYMSKGKLQPTFATHFVETSAVLQRLRDAGWLFEGVPFGYAFFSTLHPWSRIAPHSSPMNFRLRVHLPLVVPDWSFLASGTEATLRADWIRNSGGNDDDDVDRGVGIQVGPIRQEWVEGQAMVLDDSYVHRVWNESDRSRVILLVDVWHPDVAARERTEIVQLFQHAADQGWWSPSSAPPAW